MTLPIDTCNYQVLVAVADSSGCKVNPDDHPDWSNRFDWLMTERLIEEIVHPEIGEICQLTPAGWRARTKFEMERHAAEIRAEMEVVSFEREVKLRKIDRRTRIITTVLGTVLGFVIGIVVSNQSSILKWFSEVR